ncbi:hypothetical protein [Streptomyces griseoluteus]
MRSMSYAAAHLIRSSCSTGLAYAEALRRLTAAGEVDHRGRAL